MSSSSWTNFCIFATICGVAHVYHAVIKLQALTAAKTQEPGDASIINRKKKVVVISGCDRGFGLLLTKSLLEKTDYLVVALCLTPDGVDALRNNTMHQSSRLFVRQCDVTSNEQVNSVGEYCRELLLDENAVLFSIVNNAGIALAGDVLFFKDASAHQKVMDVNFFGQVRLTRALLPSLLKTSRSLTLQHPRILNITSVCGIASSASNSTYNASKFACEAWSDSIRLELEPFHIHVVKIRPGQFGTEIQKTWAETYFDSFQNAPSEIRELYGGDAFFEVAKNRFKEFGAGADVEYASPSVLIDAMQDILTMKHYKLKSAYLVGNDAQTLWRAFAILPTVVSDSMKRIGVLPYPVTHDAATSEDQKNNGVATAQ